MEDSNKYVIKLPDVRVFPTEMMRRGGSVKQKQKVQQQVSQNVKIILGDLLKKRKRTKKRKPKKKVDMGDTVQIETRERPDALITRIPQEQNISRYAYSGLGSRTYRLDAPQQSYINPPKPLLPDSYATPSSAVSSIPDFKRGEGVGSKIYEKQQLAEIEKEEKRKQEEEKKKAPLLIEKKEVGIQSEIPQPFIEPPKPLIESQASASQFLKPSGQKSIIEFLKPKDKIDIKRIISKYDDAELNALSTFLQIPKGLSIDDMVEAILQAGAGEGLKLLKRFDFYGKRKRELEVMTESRVKTIYRQLYTTTPNKPKAELIELIIRKEISKDKSLL
jgi:hypothetical protein